MMDMVQRLINRIRLHYYKLHSWEYHAIQLKLLYPNDINLDRETIQMLQLNMNIVKNTKKFFLEGYSHAKKLFDEVNAKFEISDSNVIVTIQDLTFEVQTAEELFILKEIFVEGIYNFHLVQDPDDYVLIDIGMNVAFASCYFAKNKKISRIISFEPFIPTYMQAKVNIGLNNLEEYIDARNYGLGRCDEVLSVSYSPEFKGQVGMQGTDYIRSTITHSMTEEINIKSAFEPLHSIAKENPTKRFVMKIDCEGAEYDLIGQIPHDMLERCDIIMMEWHEKGPKSIEEWLSQHGFVQISFYPYSKRAGMLYAMKVK